MNEWNNLRHKEQKRQRALGFSDRVGLGFRVKGLRQCGKETSQYIWKVTKNVDRVRLLHGARGQNTRVRGSFGLWPLC